MRRRAGVAVGFVGFIIVAGWLGVHTAIAWTGAAALSERGLECDPVDVSFAFDGSRVDIGPTRCTVGGGRVRSIRLLGGATAYLDEQRRVTRLHARGVEVTTTQDPPRRAIAGLVEHGEVPPNLRRTLDGLARLAERDDLPRLEVNRILLQRRSQFVTLRDVVIDRDGDAVAMRVSVAEPPPIGSGQLRFAGRMVDLRARATPTDVHLSGRIELEATVGRNEYEDVIPFRLDARGVGGDAPTYTAHVRLSERLLELRERSERRRAEQARAEEGPDARERLHELAEGLRGTVRQMGSATGDGD